MPKLADEFGAKRFQVRDLIHPERCLAPFERAGTLASEVTALGLQVVDGGALDIILSDEVGSAVVV